MKVGKKHYRAVWMKGKNVYLIKQNLLPFDFKILKSENYLQTCQAIKDMITRGAGSIGATAGFAMAQAFLEAPQKSFWKYIEKAKRDIESTRPTARDLFNATEKVFFTGKNSKTPVQAAIKEAQAIADFYIQAGKKIGEYGNSLIKNGSNIETHCNTGWIALVDYGTALAAIYIAHRKKKKIFVYVDETRPRNQGAKLTAWELKNEGVPHVIIPDNAGAFLMSQGKIDLMIVGADRIARNGDTANKIGTFEKAIAAKEFNIPFYVAAPISTFDINCPSGKNIPIEERSEDEVLFQTGLGDDNKIKKIRVCSSGSKAYNPAFDVTPAKYITAIITEKGIIKPNQKEIKKLLS